jgi:class 3 adenylate cyclase
MLACPNCGQQNRDAARFCDACGASLAEPAPAREERKVVTVLFADLVGFTSRAERMDPEDVRALLAPYYVRLRAELERFGGTVEKFIGDAAMALFGAPIAHEDDAERAVRAALAIRRWITEEGEDLLVRMAVNTGVALVSLDARAHEGEAMAAGDVVNTAQRLQVAAPINGILVGEQTYRATREAIEYDAAAPVEAKGKSRPILAWEALEARSRLGIDLLREPNTPFVGRQRELDLLVSALARVREERSPQLVTLVGVPGIGKSRLVLKLAMAVEQDREAITWRQGRCLPYGDGVSFWALGETVKSQAGILESDSPAQAEEKLRNAVAELVSEAQEARWVAERLRPLVGVAGEPGSVERAGEGFPAWRRFLEGLADLRPLVLVLEDLHWADEWSARLRRRARRSHSRCAAARSLHCSSRAARASARLGRREGERAHDLAAATVGGRDRPGRRLRAGAADPRGGRAQGAARASRRQSALRRAARARARRARHARRAARDRARHHRRPP